ncbi:PTS beta-glucoside transporter subunit EIIBCA [Enterococcus ureilyticus]|uniref:PTS system sucrose-specific EIIBCA component n=1 Tax=Enterococcus ureilyticus TaxID=1131292 RepID=A0A1E5H5J0_9ENTE|nr:beta-glucoside-specific PTS transporter subunit IIABC [Enterococcus ureilyticus]MBM7688958.1 PTS system beta-glucosides-specific IIC component [Enterococcus ureilyticus]MBO0446084.1 PTS glucose transporter subunit IIA [Enterococcus ureilyticus]OEG20238.1 PTS beta-glucoside transporter subunit EIIBCA [Enterococcus ureilyticus]
MNYKESAKQILDLVGGEANIQSVTHCMTRLRFVLRNESLVEDTRVKEVPGVMGVMRKGGQYQVIIGNDVASYYKELAKLGHFSNQSSTDDTGTKKNLFEAFVDVISGCMSPLIPAMLGGGMIKVLLILLPLMGILDDSSQTFAILSFFGDAPFYFMPMMLAFTAAQKFNVTPMLAVTVGGIMLHPNFVEMVNAGDPVHFLGLPVTLASYGSSVIPILIMVWLMKYIEGFFDKIIPNVIKSFTKPLLILLISGLVALIVVGPLGTFAGQLLSSAIIWIQGKAGWLALGLMAAFMPLIVMTGMHWAFAPIFLIASPATPDILILPAMLAANLAQGAAALAVSAKTKDKNLKQVAAASGISALLAGVTEPALYGITLKYKKPLYAAMISGAVCGVYMGITGLESYAFAVPSLVSLPQFIGGQGNGNIINAIVVAVISIVLTFILTWVFGIDEVDKNETEQHIEISEAVETGSNDPKKIYAPMKGQVIPLEQVKDDAFSGKMMGEGLAIIPEEDTIKAPFDGEVTALFPTKHAIGLTSDSGIELLIHVGIDTVELAGQYFTAFVETGDKIKKGQKLLSVDFAQIKTAGYDTTTPIVVTNSEAFIDVVAKEGTETESQETILYIV